MVICLVIAAAAVIVHLTALHKGWGTLQSVSKAFLIPSLFLLLFVSMAETGRSLSYQYLLLLPALFYTAGDILLEAESRPCCFYIGACSFIVGHLCYAAFFQLSFGFVFSSFAIWAIIWSLAFILVYRHVAAYGHKETPLQFLYIFFVLVMGVSLGCSSYGGALHAKLVGMAGAFIFALSDLMIVMRRIKDTREYEMAIMVTYILANALILLSLYLAAA